MRTVSIILTIFATLSLSIVGAHAGSWCAHYRNGAGRRQIEIDQNIAGVSVTDMRSDVNVEAFAVAYTQESDHPAATELETGPERFGGKQSSGLMMNQAKQVQVAGHSGQLPANGLQGDEESSVHDRGIAWTSGTSPQKRNFLLCRKEELSTLP